MGKMNADHCLCFWSVCAVLTKLVSFLTCTRITVCVHSKYLEVSFRRMFGSYGSCILIKDRFILALRGYTCMMQNIALEL